MPDTLLAGRSIPPKDRVRSAVLDAFGVVATAGRLVGRHWPALVSLFLAGYVGRELAMRAAVRTSELDGTLGFLVLVFAPLATLTALVLMLRVTRSSLPWLRMATADSNEQTVVAGSRPHSLLNYLGSALVPFLAVYASYGYLKQDVSDYGYRVFAAAVFGDAEIFNGKKIDVLSRLPFTFGAVLGAVVVIAVALRWLLSRFEGRPRLAWLGILGAYVEVLWITIVAWTLADFQDTATGWARERRAVHWAEDSWSATMDAIGPLATPTREVAAWLGGLLGSVDAVLVVPLAWLAVGAVVYGHRVAPPPPAGELLRAASRRWSIVPAPLRRVGGALTSDLRERFGPLVDGLRLVVRAGLAPMLLFCVAFLIAQTASKWLWELERLLIGAQDVPTVWLAIDEPLGVFNDLVATVLLVCLLGAAIDRVLRNQGHRASRA
jgi:hypothetical protein